MVIWLRNASVMADAHHAIGMTCDVVRAEQLATLVEIDSAYDSLNRQCDALLDEARAQAEAILAAARTQANDLIAQARLSSTSASRMGYEAGWGHALADWHERSLRLQADMPSIGQRQRDRLAQLVVLAVEQIVATADPVALFKQAAATVGDNPIDGSPVKVRVHPDDLAAAIAAFDAVSRDWKEAGRAVRLQLNADAQLERGHCICETDLGALDASLPQQLAAIREALSRAVNSHPQDEDETGLQPVNEAGHPHYAGAQDGTVEKDYEDEGETDRQECPQQNPEEADIFADAFASIGNVGDADVNTLPAELQP
jgi:type III secretion protein L